MHLKYIGLFLIVYLIANVTSDHLKGENEYGPMKSSNFINKAFGMLGENMKPESFESSVKNGNNSFAPKQTHILAYETANLPVNPVFDERYDALPPQCQRYRPPSNCAEATECTQKSGLYYITAPITSASKFLAFCDAQTEQGDWIYVVKRVDGSENFTRSWSDYTKGFGNAAGEYWIGLENLYALTNYGGPQELYVYIESFDGETRFARYDNFLIGSAAEYYKIKSLGRYSGTAGDSMTYNLGARFSTYDNQLAGLSCAAGRMSGWWFDRHSTDDQYKCACSCSHPTGVYMRGTFSHNWYYGIVWNDFKGLYYSHKTMIFMIRRRKF